MFRDNFQPLAAENRRILRDAGVFTINVVGPSGSGKSALIDAALAQLPQFNTAVIYACPCPGCDYESHDPAPSVRRIPIHAASIHAEQVHDVLKQLDLATLDLLIIESTTSTAVPAEEDLGEDIRVGVLSVVAGDDKALQYARLVRGADALVLTKTDLLPHVRFDLERFRADVHRLNEALMLLEVSSLRREEVDQWVEWLARTVEAAPRTEILTTSELFFG